MVEAYPNDDTFVPDQRICVTFMNGKVDLLVLNRRYAKGYSDITPYLINDERTAGEIAKLLGMTAMHHRDIDKRKFNDVMSELKKLILKNAKAGFKTFLYLQFSGYAVEDKNGLI